MSITRQDPPRDAVGRVDRETRSFALARAVQDQVTAGWRIESQTDDTVVMVRGRRPNHLLHFLISGFTIGAWVPVWIVLSIRGGETRQMVVVDHAGDVGIRPVD